MLINQIFAHIATTAMLAVSAFFAAQLMWQVAAPTPPFIPLTPQSALQDTTQDTSSSAGLFARYALFGTYTPPRVVEAAPEVVELVPTPPPEPRPTVRFALKGILDFGVNKFAIIAMNGQEETVTEGDYVDYLQVAEVHADHIIVVAPGIREQVFVDDANVEIKDTAAVAEASRLPPLPVSDANTFVPELDAIQVNALNQMRQTLNTNPLEMLNKVRVAPLRQGGKVAGYRVAPGSEARLFNAVGLRPGDVIKEVNGQAMAEVNTFREGVKFASEIGKQTRLDVVVEREGAEKRIVIDLSNAR